MRVLQADYSEFLNTFLKGEVTRLVVVERFENPSGPKLASGWLPGDLVIPQLIEDSEEFPCISWFGGSDQRMIRGHRRAADEV